MDKVGPYPTCHEHAHRWEQLAREIAASQQHRRDNPSSAATPKGTLIVLGSGIEGISFTMGAEAYLRAADKVFYCVSDAPTQVWLRTMRPDAYDLYVLYDDTKARYKTYIQMSEAILHYVRLGMRVVAVYYGHPGIFVYPSHRAIAIARREGHSAVMKPGISALDCLCADLGVDPAFPGMQTYEATDLLLRRRALDTTAHVVLWQVGGIGDGGYRRRGLMNDKFPLLVDYLDRIYGPEHEVTHYIAARHPAFEPTIAVHEIARLRDPSVRATLSGFSTFYIPPKHAAPTDPEMAVQIGMIQPGEKPVDQPALRPMATYDRYDLAAIQEFERFHVPEDYQFLERTRAAEFLIEMGQDIALQDLYRKAPAQAVAEESFPGLSATERQLLAQRDEGWALLATRGALVSASPNEQFVIDLHGRRDLAGGFRAALASAYGRADVAAAIDSWISSQGYRAALAHLPATSRLVNASMLLPWTGVYATADGSVVLTVLGSPDSNRSSLVYVGETPIVQFTFHDGTLIWEAADGNPSNGELTFRMPSANGSSAFVRTVSGTLYAADAVKPLQPNVEATEAVAASTVLSMWTGRYTTRAAKDSSEWEDGPDIEVVTPRPGQVPDRPRLVVQGQSVDGARFDHRTARWGSNHITFSHDSDVPGRHLLSGEIDGRRIAGVSAAGHHAPFEGRYRIWSWSGTQWKPSGDFHYDGSTVRLGRNPFEGAVFEHNVLQWQDANGERSSGRIHFFVDPATQLPKFIGYHWSAGPRPDHPNLAGVLSTDSIAGLSSSRSEDGDVAPRVWEALAAIGLQDRDPSCHLLWSRWQQARFTCRLLSNLVPRICEVERVSQRFQTAKGG